MQEMIEGYMVGVLPNNSAGYSNITILDMAGTEHNVSIFSVDFEGKCTMLGDNVRVNIFRDSERNIKNDQIEINEISAEISEEIIEGEVTGINNSNSRGSSELTIKDADRNEHVVNVPFTREKTSIQGTKSVSKLSEKPKG